MLNDSAGHLAGSFGRQQFGRAPIGGPPVLRGGQLVERGRVRHATAGPDLGPGAVPRRLSEDFLRSLKGLKALKGLTGLTVESFFSS